MGRTEEYFPFTVEERVLVLERCNDDVDEQRAVLDIASDALLKLRTWHTENPTANMGGISLEGAYQGYHTLFIGFDEESSAFKNIFQSAHTTFPSIVRELLLAHALVMKQKGPEGYNAWLTYRIEDPNAKGKPSFVQTLNAVFA